MSIVLERLSKSYGIQTVVDQVSLEVRDAELFVLLGASGSGKSTILRMIAGLALPDSGRVFLQGKDVTQDPPQKRGTGFVFQNYTIFRHMTVARNIEFGLRIRRVPRARRAERVERLLDLVGLGGLGTRYASQLSGGQQQRVALARALAYEPAVLLLDEPFGALDVKIRDQLRRSLKAIQRQLRVTMILVTHDQEEAFQLGDRIGVLDKGRLLEVGAPEDLYCRPQSEEVATFLGAGNLLVGRAAEGQAVLGPLSLPLPLDAPHEAGARVRLLFRPEQTLLTSDKPPPELPVIGQGSVVEHVFAGSARRVRLRLPRLPGVRQVAPPLPFGEDGLLIDAVLPADAEVPRGPVWLGLRGYHVLRQAPWRLILGDPAGHAAAARLSQWLAERLPAEVHRLAGRHTPGDIVVLGLDDPETRVAAVAELLEDRDVPPILAVCGDRPSVASILVCTAIGEPGKQDVLFGGRLARRLRAEVTMLHCLTPGDEPAPRVLIHMEQSMASLRALDLRGRIELREATSPAVGILAAAQEGNHDLLVLGVARPGRRAAAGRPDVASRVLERADRPVLLIPAAD
jgi:sulfate/thiosulfate transport system ATP-binding protein